MALPSRHRITTVFCIVAVVASIMLVLQHATDATSEAAASAESTSRPIVVKPLVVPAANTELDTDARLQAALRELKDGATCEDRKEAIGKLVGLAQTKAVPALQEARTAGRENACLRAAAGAAIRALNGSI